MTTSTILHLTIATGVVSSIVCNLALLATVVAQQPPTRASAHEEPTA